MPPLYVAYVNGARTDSLELGTFTTFQQRTLYETFDVTALVRPGAREQAGTA